MRAYARIVDPSGETWLLGPGDVVGRVATAALVIDDARVSEAHAMVSLRGGALHLLGLRGMMAVAGVPSADVALAPGLEVELAPGVALTVEELALPDFVLALEGEGLPRQVLIGTCSLLRTPQLALVGRYREDALAHIWSRGDGWRLQVRGAAARDLSAGDSFEVAGQRLRVVEVALERASQPRTSVEGGLHAALHVLAYLDTVHIQRSGEAPLVIDGIGARILTELVAIGGPVSWEVLAGEIWRGDDDRAAMRRRWDVSLARLRRKLREGRVRPDLVRAGGTGQVELLLYPGDRADDLS